MTRYLIVRHGETKLNVQNRHQCWVDSPLTEKGIRQVKQTKETTYKILEDGKVSKIYSSDLGRVKETVKILTEGNNTIPVEYSAKLREQKMGDYDGLTTAKVEKLDPGFTERRAKDRWGVRPPNGESYTDALERVKPTLSKIMMNHQRNETILIAGHRATGRIIIGYLLGYSKEEILRINLPPGSAFYIQNNKGTLLNPKN